MLTGAHSGQAAVGPGLRTINLNDFMPGSILHKPTSLKIQMSMILSRDLCQFRNKGLMGSHLSFKLSIFLGLLLFLLLPMQASTQPSKPNSNISFSQKSSQIFYSPISFKKISPKACNAGVSSQGTEASTVHK